MIAVFDMINSIIRDTRRLLKMLQSCKRCAYSEYALNGETLYRLKSLIEEIHRFTAELERLNCGKCREHLSLEAL